MIAVDANSLVREFGPHRALDDFSVTVEEGTIVGIIGPSGGGKTTAVRLLCGIDRPTSGTVHVYGKHPSTAGRELRRRIALLAQDPALVDEFTIRAQVEFAARIRRCRPDATASLLEWLGLSDATETRLSDASGGMRRRTGLAAALVSDPDLLFCDEPTAGLDPIVRDDIWRLFRRRRSRGQTMVITTQHIDEAARCDRVLVLREGRVIADAEPEGMAERAGLPELVIVDLEGGQTERARTVVARAGFENVIVRRDVLEISTSDAPNTAAEVSRQLHDAGIAVASIDTVIPGLDAVFRSLVERP